MSKTFVLGSILIVIIICSVSYGLWILKRNWNYNWGYESQVEETICEMVKPENLINPAKCN